MKSHKNAKETRKTNTSNEAKYAIWISIISLIISSAISLYTFSETNRVSEQLLQYQLEQERLPRIMALNYKFPVNILKVNDNGWYGIDSRSIPDNCIPIKIPIYNVGIGLAQNCRISWNDKSINNACAHMIDLLSQYYSIHEYELAKIADESAIRWAHNDFVFSKRDGVYNTVRYLAYFSSTSGIDKVIEEKSIICENLELSYILPILNEKDPSYISLSDGLSMLLLEISNCKICEPISFCFEIAYQDLTGLNYSHIIEATFLLNSQENTNEPCFFDVSFNIVDSSS